MIRSKQSSAFYNICVEPLSMKSSKIDNWQFTDLSSSIYSSFLSAAPILTACLMFSFFNSEFLKWNLNEEKDQDGLTITGNQGWEQTFRCFQCDDSCGWGRAKRKRQTHVECASRCKTHTGSLKRRLVGKWPWDWMWITLFGRIEFRMKNQFRYRLSRPSANFHRFVRHSTRFP